MWKKWTVLPLALMLLVSPALAEVYAGVTAARSTVTVCADSVGDVTALAAEVGQRVTEGETLIALSGERTFASQDGTVSLLNAQAGDAVSGTVLELAPTERYTIHCTVDKAWQSAASTLVHSGETLYVKCTADGTHRAIGVVTQIDGEEYRVLTLGGELYVGETVYLYRDADFTTAQRVGIGTVVVSDTQTYAAEGRLTRLNVQAGGEVERGQLLYETDGGQIAAPVSGILTALSPQSGETLTTGQVVAEIAPESEIRVAVQMDETAVSAIALGEAVQLTFASHPEETVDGTVTGISDIAESGLYTVYITPEATEALVLGMSVEVRTRAA